MSIINEIIRQIDVVKKHFAGEYEEEENQTPLMNTNYPAFQTMKNIINTILTTSEFNTAIIQGGGGLGKTIVATSEIEKKIPKGRYNKLIGYTTPLQFYIDLYNNRFMTVVLIDDVDGILGSPIGLAIFKCLAWGGMGDEKEIEYKSSKGALGQTPRNFKTKCKYVILCNKIPGIKKNEDVDAALSRTIWLKDFNINEKEKRIIASDIIDLERGMTLQEKEFAKQIMRKNKLDNFRELKKLIAFIKTDATTAEQMYRETR